MNTERTFIESVQPFVGAEQAITVLGEVWKAYSAPDRHYHDWAHVSSMLDGMSLFGSDPAVDPYDMVLAIVFHDVVYDARRADNEAASAAFFNQRLVELPEMRRTRVTSLIMATDHRRPITTREEAVIVDLDLAILGAAPERYAAYVAGVRKEYAFVPDDAWRTGRAAVLEGFLRRRRIFSTEEMAHLDGQAWTNLTSELRSLDPSYGVGAASRRSM